MKKLIRKFLTICALVPALAHAEPGEVTLAAVLLAAADTAVAIIAANYIIIAEIALAVYGAVAARRRAAQAAAEARDKYNSNLIDRVTTLVNPNPPWRVVYGKCITGGDVVAIFTSDKVVTESSGGTHIKPDSYKHLVVHVATHQIQSFNDTIIAGIRLGRLDADGWVHSTSAGTGEGYSISETCAAGTTTIPLAGGTGTVLVGDSISFVGDPTRYTVTVNPGHATGGITGSGQSLTIAAPGLAVLTVSGTTCDLGHEFSRPAAVLYYVDVGASASLTIDKTADAVVSTTDPGGGGNSEGEVINQASLSVDGHVITNTNAFPVTVGYQVTEVNPTVRVSYHTGSPDQTVDTYLQGIAPVQWDATHRLRGMAYAVITLDLEDVRFQAGLPQMSFDVNGALVYDPRNGTKGYSNNPALCARDYLTALYGFMVKDSDIDDTYTIAAANACDTLVDFSYVDVLGRLNTINDKQYTCNGSFTTADSVEATLNNIATSMAGTVAYGGQWLIMPGVWTPSVMDLTDDDLDGQISIVQAGTGLDQLFNGAHASYLPYNRVSPQDITPYQNAVFLAADGEELWSDFTLPYTDSEVRARSIVRVLVERNRNGLVIQYPAKLRAWPVRIGDRVRVSSTEYGFALKFFRVTDWQFGINTSVNLTLEEDGADAYDQADAIQVDPTPNTLLPNPYKVSPMQNLALHSGTATLQKLNDGTILPRVLATWDRNTSAYVADGGQIEIAWQSIGDTDWALVVVDGDDTQAFITGVVEARVIVVRATAVNSLGVRSNPVYDSIEVIGKLQPPADVAGFHVENTPSGVKFSWTPNTEADYLQTEVHEETSWNELASPLWVGSSSFFVLPYPTNGVYHFTAKHRDTSGNESVDYASYALDIEAPAGTAATTWLTLSGIPANIQAAASDGGNLVNSALTPSISAAQAAANAMNVLSLVVRGGMTLIGNTVTKSSGSGGWDADAYSKESYTGGAFVTAVPSSTGYAIMFGLNSDPAADSSYASLDYSVYLRSDGVFDVYENGGSVSGGPGYGSYAAGDVFGVLYDGHRVGYTRNGTVFHSADANPGQVLSLDTSFATPGGTLTNIRFGPLTPRNSVYYQSTAPTGALNGDLWYNTVGFTWEALIGGTWTIVSDVTAQKIASGIAGQGSLATLNAVDTGQIQPHAVTTPSAAVLSSGVAYAGTEVLVLQTSIDAASNPVQINCQYDVIYQSPSIAAFSTDEATVLRVYFAGSLLKAITIPAVAPHGYQEDNGNFTQFLASTPSGVNVLSLTVQAINQSPFATGNVISGNGTNLSVIGFKR